MTITVYRRSFHADDRIGIGAGTKKAVFYRCIESNEYGHVFQAIDNLQRIERFTHEEFATIELTPGYRIIRHHDNQQRQAARLRSDIDRLCDLPKRELPKVLWKHAWCRKFLELETVDRVSRSQKGLEAFIETFKSQIPAETPKHRTKRAGAQSIVREPPSWKTLHRWLLAYEKADFDPLAHRDRYWNCGGDPGTFPPEVQAHMVIWAWKYATRSRPLKVHLYGGLKDDIRRLNAERVAKKLPLLPVPSLKTFRKRIRSLPVFDVFAGRFGLDRARKRFVIVSSGVDAVRPGDRVEIDQWRIPLHVYLILTGLWEKLSGPQREQLKPVRMWLTVAIDVASRCIVGMRMSPTESAEAAIATVKMAISDKGRYADAVGALTQWSMNAGIETLAHDQGPSLIGAEFQGKVLGICANPFAPPAGLAYLRAHIERAFSTFHTECISRFDGRTFENVVAKGDYDSEANATLTVEQLCFALVRYVVDAYHNSPHAGLGGETPAHAWARLTKLYGTVPPPDRDTRRNVFGIQLVRNLDSRGVRVLNLHYNSLELQEYRRQVGDGLVEVTTDLDDLGRVSVMAGDGKLTVPCVRPGFDNVSAADWMEIRIDLRRRFPNSDIPENAVYDTLATLDRLAIRAGSIAEIASPDLTPAQLDQAESDAEIAFSDANITADVDAADADIFDNVQSGPNRHNDDASDEPPQHGADDRNDWPDDDWSVEEN